MIVHMYSIYDKVTGAFMHPFYARSRGEAIRSFSDAANDEKSQLSRHVNDYSLYIVGEFDDASGVITPVAVDRVINAREVVMREVKPA